MKFNVNKYHQLCLIKEGLPLEEENPPKPQTLSKKPNNETYDAINPVGLISDNEKDTKSVLSDIPPISNLSTNPNEPPINPGELLHQRVVSNHLNEKSGLKIPKSKGKKRTILIEKSLKSRQKTKLSTLGDAGPNKEKDEDTGIEILDMHRKIVEEVSKVRYDDRLTIVEQAKTHINLHILSLASKHTFHIFFRWQI